MILVLDAECPHCKKKALVMLRPNSNVCGCEGCGTTYKYPSLEQINPPVMEEQEQNK